MPIVVQYIYMALQEQLPEIGIFNGETYVRRSAGAIFYIEDTREYMFFQRDDKPGIPEPNKVDIIGGGLEAGETPEAGARRELAEELLDLDTGQPFTPPELVPFTMGDIIDDVENHVFICPLPTKPNLRLLEGQRLVFLTKEQLPEADFAFSYKELALRVAKKIEQDKGALNPLVYPLGYFAAQVTFAQRWAEVAGGDWLSTLRTHTAIARVMLGCKVRADEEDSAEWQTIRDAIADTTDPQTASYTLHHHYASSPRSRYAPPNHPFGGFAYHYHPNRQAAQLHFDNPQRGESPLSDKNILTRGEEFMALVQDIRSRHPDVRRFIAGSWLFSVPNFRGLFPRTIELGPPPDFSLQGNSVWGQFMNKDGNVQRRNYEQFLRSLNTADTPEQLIGALPLTTLFTNNTIDKYYEHYNITN